MAYPRKLDGRDWVAAAAMRANGSTYQEIAAHYDMTPSGVRDALRRTSQRQDARCGRLSGYQRHLQDGTRPCLPCCAANTQKQAAWRARKGSGSAPATDARELLHAWLDAGWTINAVSRRAGISSSALYTLNRGEYRTVQLRTLTALRRLGDPIPPAQEAA